MRLYCCSNLCIPGFKQPNLVNIPIVPGLRAIYILIGIKNAPFQTRFYPSGEGGIRTLGSHKDYSGFRDRPVQPLRHLSSGAICQIALCAREIIP